MNSEFAKRALQPIDPETVWSAETDPDHCRTPMREQDSGIGVIPSNRHERRKANKLLRERHAKTVRP